MEEAFTLGLEELRGRGRSWIKGAYAKGEPHLGTCKGSELGKWKVCLWVFPTSMYPLPPHLLSQNEDWRY